TRNLPPLVGGMERLNWHLAAELSKTAEVRVIGPAGGAALAPAGVSVREVPLRPLWKFLLCAWHTARREARRWRPDVVLAGSGLTAPLARAAARVCGARSAVYAHGLDIAVQHPVYRAIWLPAIRAMDVVIANSHATAGLCRGVGVADERLTIVHPGVDLPPTPVTGTMEAATHGADIAANNIRQHLGLDQCRILLSVGRLSTRKGLREFVTHSLPRVVATCPDVMLVVVGDAPAQALHATAQTPDSIRAAAAEVGVGDHLKFLGIITDYAKLGAIYRAADVHVFPVREIPGDPEGFGMVAVEAAAHGLPTVAFATGGVVDAVAEGQSGHLVKTGDYAAFAQAVTVTLADEQTWAPRCEAFAARFAWSAFGEQTRAALAPPTA
ncbi:MAG TPA: glycosyltransferase family 4 protein, partial [Rhodanobacteraceae bacterium]